MLALRHRSRQVVMADEELQGPDMVGELLGKGQRVAHQPCNTLPQRVVEPFDVIGFAGLLADGLVLRPRRHLRIDDILIRIKRGVRTVRVRDLGPQVRGTRMAAIADCKAMLWRVVASVALHTHRLWAFCCTKLASASASPSRRWIRTSC